MPPAKATYHHGDLAAALLGAALDLLEEKGETALSLRAVARRAGVSPAAPYRHYEDREALTSAVAAVGYRELAERLAAAHPAPSTPEQLTAVAVAYVRFALERPALFRVMFSEPCDRDNDERVAAIAAVKLYLEEVIARCFPGSDPEALAPAIWALVHGLAFLFLDGKLDAPNLAAVDKSVAEAIHGLLGAAAQASA
jgi:AcrR family transcriptional regulator